MNRCSLTDRIQTNCPVMLVRDHQLSTALWHCVNHGVSAAQSTVMRWVLRCALELENVGGVNENPVADVSRYPARGRVSISGCGSERQDEWTGSLGLRLLRYVLKKHVTANHTLGAYAAAGTISPVSEHAPALPHQAAQAARGPQPRMTGAGCAAI